MGEIGDLHAATCCGPASAAVDRVHPRCHRRRGEARRPDLRPRRRRRRASWRRRSAAAIAAAKPASSPGATNSAAPSHSSRKVAMSLSTSGATCLRRLEHRQPEGFVAGGAGRTPAAPPAARPGRRRRDRPSGCRCAGATVSPCGPRSGPAATNGTASRAAARSSVATSLPASHSRPAVSAASAIARGGAARRARPLWTTCGGHAVARGDAGGEGGARRDDRPRRRPGRARSMPPASASAGGSGPPRTASHQVPTQLWTAATQGPASKPAASAGWLSWTRSTPSRRASAASAALAVGDGGGVGGQPVEAAAGVEQPHPRRGRVRALPGVGGGTEQGERSSPSRAARSATGQVEGVGPHPADGVGGQQQPRSARRAIGWRCGSGRSPLAAAGSGRSRSAASQRARRATPSRHGTRAPSPSAAAAARVSATNYAGRRPASRRG